MKKIAVAVKDTGKKVEHFGICEYFLVYNYDENNYNMEYDNIIFSSKNHKQDNEEWEKSADSIKNCDIVICEKIGPIAKAEVEMMDIKVIVEEGEVEDVLDRFIQIERNKGKIL
ncbi:MAG: dinitrogenase iron-molybdenum cofactor biosynthesis protein [Methanosphaera sp.]|nr:dinitrogenase iron-molybdenum cofactor biosynthesis protein [Methanosphaera sp.]